MKYQDLFSLKNKNFRMSLLQILLVTLRVRGKLYPFTRGEEVILVLQRIPLVKGEMILSKVEALFYFPSKKGSSVKGKNLLL